MIHNKYRPKTPKKNLSKLIVLSFSKFKRNKLFLFTSRPLPSALTHYLLHCLISVFLLIILCCHFLYPVGPDYKCDEDTEFSCKTNYRCIPQWARCDGTNDCIDNSDEQGCGQCLCISRCVVMWRQGCNKDCTSWEKEKSGPRTKFGSRILCVTVDVFLEITIGFFSIGSNIW